MGREKGGGMEGRSEEEAAGIRPAGGEEGGREGVGEGGREAGGRGGGVCGLWCVCVARGPSPPLSRPSLLFSSFS